MQATLTSYKVRFFTWQFLLFFGTFLLTENIFNWIIIGNSMVIEGYTKLLGLGIYAFMLFKYKELKKEERVYMVLFTLMMLRLVFESLFKFDSFFKQLTMFTVHFPVVYVIYIKYLLRWMDVDLLGFVAKFYMVTYFVFMLLFGRGFSFSLDAVDMVDYGPFAGDGRVIHATHVLMMIIPLLWYLHQFIVTNKKKYLWPFLICVIIILIHQHRSVWSSAMLALFFYLIGAIRNKYLKAGKIVSITIGAIALIFLMSFLATTLMPKFLVFFAERFGEIFNPAKEGSTGNFRLEQREVYGEMFLKRPIFGWTFEGFEMPNPMVDWWPPMTGQHFHEGFMEMLFYHGIAGLLLKYGVLLYMLVKTMARGLSGNSIILISFCVSGLLFSLNYVPPLVFWGVVGMALYYIEADKKNRKLKTAAR
ncbi:MAG: O-antigen ligase family protein [Chitinophagaceae bacterium]